MHMQANLYLTTDSLNHLLDEMFRSIQGNIGTVTVEQRKVRKGRIEKLILGRYQHLLLLCSESGAASKW